MSLPTHRAYNHERWFAVYGAYIAQQVQDFASGGWGAPDELTMRRFVEEAVAVADLAAKAYEALDP